MNGTKLNAWWSMNEWAIMIWTQDDNLLMNIDHHWNLKLEANRRFAPRMKRHFLNRPHLSYDICVVFFPNRNVLNAIFVTHSNKIYKLSILSQCSQKDNRLQTIEDFNKHVIKSQNLIFATSKINCYFFSFSNLNA